MSAQVDARRPPAMLRALVLVVLVPVLALLGVLVAPPASAHSGLIGSTPTDSEQLEAPPSELVLEFSEDVQGIGTEVVVTDAEGSDVTDGDPVVDGPVVTVPLAAAAAGGYDVIWRVVSADGHPIEGELAFTAAAGAAQPTTAASSDAPSTTTEAAEPSSSPAPAATMEATSTTEGTDAGAGDEGGTDPAPIAIGVVVIGAVLLAALLVLRRLRARHGRP